MQINVGHMTVNIYTTAQPNLQAQQQEVITTWPQRPPVSAERLVDEINNRPQPWRPKKRKALKLSEALHSLGHGKKANRVYWCSDELVFAECAETGRKKLKMANFCRERLCVMCSWRLSIKTFYQLSQVLDVAQEENPGLVPIFLTLTVKNCSGEDLGATLDMMFSSWHRLMSHRRISGAIKGWFRALEVTYNKVTDSYHPHFHAIMLVEESYFFDRSAYMRTEDWVHMWRTSCRLDYDPVCDIRAVRSKSSKRKRTHVAEVAKYTVKDADYIHDDKALTERVVDVLGRALYRRRLFAYGGILKVIAKRLKADQEPENLVNIDEEATMREDIAQALIVYKWDFGLADYFRRDIL